MSSFGFVPRSLSKRKGVHAPLRQQPITNPASNGLREESVAGPSTLKEELDKPKFTTDDITSLVRLCLSRYSCWFNSELFQVIRESGEGYVPIQYLLDNVSPLCELENKPSELEIVQALRSVQHEDCGFEVRMIIREPTRNEWLRPSSSNSRDDIGTFEVRSKDHAEVVSWLDGGDDDSQQQRVDKRYWDLRTVYIEHIPTMYRTKHAIAQYIYQLLINNRSRKHGKQVSGKECPIHAVTFPAHHLSSHNADENAHGQRRAWYKGFAFVILDSPLLLETLCEDYPWNRDAKFLKRSKHVGDVEDLTLAVKFGTRVLSKAVWEELKKEYLEYQRKIVSLNSGTVSGVEELSSSAPESLEKDMPSAPVPVERHHESNKLGSGPSFVSHTREEFVPPPPIKSYPENCLVFIKNTHPETNKTTLRQLFSSVLSTPSSLDYVDFTKGVDSCHLRLTNASEAKRLVACFSAGVKPHKAQLGALDNESGIPTADRPAIVAELVQGKREELYWEKVPQKSREKALITARGQTALLQDGDELGETRSGDRRKRRKSVKTVTTYHSGSPSISKSSEKEFVAISP